MKLPQIFDACDVYTHDEIVVDERGRHFQLREDGTVDFGSVSRGLLGQQSQYGSRWIDGTLDGYASLGVGLEFTDGYGNPGDPKEFHMLGIRAEDIPVFVGRVLAYRTLTFGTISDGTRQRSASSEEISDARQFLLNQAIELPL